MAKTQRKSVLGRGLNSLIEAEPVGSSRIGEIEIEAIKPNPDQPRRTFDAESIEELATSIKNLGLVQPITVRRDGDTYLIISGERRWRASQLAGLETIPAYIRTADDENMMAMALVENIQREDLNAIEIALSYQKLLDIHHLTQEELAGRMGKKRATISNYLRLLRLPAEVQIGLTERRLDMGHARALLRVPSPEMQLELYQRVLAEGLNVRQVEAEAERMATALSGTPKKTDTGKRQRTVDAFKDLAEQLSTVFGARVKLSSNTEGKGQLVISFRDEDQLAEIMLLLERLRKK